MSYCEHCLFFQIEFVQGPTPGDRLIGHCQGLPPTAGKPTPLKPEAKTAKLSHFPLVKGNDWCGEFQRASSGYRRMSAPEPKKGPLPDRRLVVSSSEAADMLGVSDRHLHRMSVEQDLPRVMIGARVCYRIETLKRWLAENELTGPTDRS